MKSPHAALAAAYVLVAAAPLPAPAAEDPAPGEEKYFRAFYLETGLRDFLKAEALYGEVAAEARAAKNPSLEGKAQLGKARCAKERGRTEEAKAAARAALELDGGSAEAKALLAGLEGGGGGTEDQGLERRVGELVRFLQTSDILGAWRELRLLGDTALPYLAVYLRERELGSVEAATRFLASGVVPAGRKVLLEALSDPEVVFSRAVAEQILRMPKPDPEQAGRRAPLPADVPLLAAIARSKDPELRARVVAVLNEADLGGIPEAMAAIRALASDSDPGVRLAVLREDWYDSYWTETRAVVAAGLSSGRAEEREAAIFASNQDREFLRSVAMPIRSLLRDPEASVRRAALAVLRGADGLAEADAAAFLADRDPEIVKGGADLLRELGTWSAATREAVLGAAARAIRGEIPGSAAEPVLRLVTGSWKGEATADGFLALYALTWAPENRLGARAAEAFRGALHEHLRGNTRDQDRVLPRGVETIPSVEGRAHWLHYWRAMRIFHFRAGVLGAASPDAEVRAAAYTHVACGVRPEGMKEPPPLPFLAKDLASEDVDLVTAAVGVIGALPDAAPREALRELHGSKIGTIRSIALQALARAEGAAAEPLALEDLASPEPEVRSMALRVLVKDLGRAEIGIFRDFLAKGGTPREACGLWLGDPKPPLPLLQEFLELLGPARIDQTCLRAAALLKPGTRDGVLASVLRGGSPGMRGHAASLVASWRAVELTGALGALLDDPEASVQAAAAKALEDLRKYQDQKMAAARLRQAPEEDPAALARKLLADQDPAKRRGAVLALGALQDKAAIALLLKALDDPDASVREAALAALERLGGKPK